MSGFTSAPTFTYGYTHASQLQTVSDSVDAAPYYYVANSLLVDHIAYASNGVARMTTTKSYDNLNRLWQISSSRTPGTAPGPAAFTYNYQYNDANQRVRVNTPDGSYWLYGFDKLGQVTSAKRYWSDGTPVAGQQFEYTFDDIGNRTQTKAGGDSAGGSMRTASYTANRLNQYSSRVVPGTNDIVGSAASTATVLVNLQSTYRKGEYYQKALVTNNNSGPVYLAITNRAGLAGVTNIAIGNLWVPQTPENFVYDLDGNLAADGRWTYSWDGENRLTNLISAAGAPTLSKRQVGFDYDAKGRRILKVTSTNNGTTYLVQSTRKFVYDGWNLVAILDGNNTLLQSFVWGTDLSGSFQAAGGVGGLISLTDYQTGTAGRYFYAFDGNGNVVALVNATDGSVSAQYEYDAFGNAIRSSGLMAKANHFRFSTKYEDDETGLLYFGYRYYNALTGRWLTRDPMQEEGGIALNAFVANDPNNDLDYLGLKGNGHHIVPWSIFNNAVSEEVQKFFDSDVARIFNSYYKAHGTDRLEGISAFQYNKLVSEELKRYLGKTAMKDMTLQQAQDFLAIIKGAPANTPIAIYNNAVKKQAADAMRKALAEAAEKSAASSVEKVLGAGARRSGAKLTKAIPLVGAVVAVYFYAEDAEVYGAVPSAVNTALDAVPLLGTAKVISEALRGYRFLDVTVGPKTVQPSEGNCGK